MTWQDIRYFSPSEFDSPDLPGSGETEMQLAFVARLDMARHLAGIPFHVNSGFRSQSHHDHLTAQGYHTAVDSPHLRGWAADIHVRNSTARFKIIDALLNVGFDRVGVAKTFIHCDMDPNKTPAVIWLYR